MTKIKKTELARQFLATQKENEITFDNCAKAHKAFAAEMKVDVSYVLFNREYRKMFPPSDAPPVAKKKLDVPKPIEVRTNEPPKILARERGFHAEILGRKLKIDDRMQTLRNTESVLKMSQDRKLVEDIERSMQQRDADRRDTIDALLDLVELYEKYIPEALKVNEELVQKWGSTSFGAIFDPKSPVL